MSKLYIYQFLDSFEYRVRIWDNVGVVKELNKIVIETEYMSNKNSCKYRMYNNLNKIVCYRKGSNWIVATEYISFEEHKDLEVLLKVLKKPLIEQKNKYAEISKRAVKSRELNKKLRAEIRERNFK